MRVDERGEESLPSEGNLPLPACLSVCMSAVSHPSTCCPQRRQTYVCLNIYLKLMLSASFLPCTVQTFNSCTSRLVVCQCLVGQQTPVDNMSKYDPSTSMDRLVCESKSRLHVRPSVHPCPGNWSKAGMRSCIGPRHLVQELNVGTVDWCAL